MKPITKSQFKLGLECLRKLEQHRANLRPEIADQALLSLLAEGGGTVEALQRAIEAPAWVGPDGGAAVAPQSLATVQAAIAEVQEGTATRSLYEVTITQGDFLARIDLLRIRKDRLELVEIKSKSWDGPKFEAPLADIVSKDGEKVLSPWVPYLQDLAFQTELLRRWLREHADALGLRPDFPITPKLILVKAGGVATANDCLPNFRTRYENSRGERRAEVTFIGPTLTSTDLLIEADASAAILLMEKDAQAKAFGFDELGIAACMDKLASMVRENTWPGRFCSLSNLCKDCDYRRVAAGWERALSCWSGNVDDVSQHILKFPWVTKKQVGQAIERSGGQPLVATFSHLQLEDLQPRQKKLWPDLVARRRVVSAELRRDRFGVLQAPAEGPVYFLDFETSRYPIPYRAGGRVNALVPFQFEGHRLPHRAANVTERMLLPGFLDLATPDPRRGMARALCGQFGDRGPIYHWSPYEEQVIRSLALSLAEENRPEPGDAELIAGCHRLADRLVDLCAITHEHLVLPETDGSYSIKRVLPVIWADEELRRGFGPGRAPGDPNHYVDPGDPYQSLPGLSRKFLEQVGETAVAALANQDNEGDAITNGGLAMVYYHYVRLFGGHDDPDIQRQFRQYCQLDSAAMVMAYDFLRRVEP